jgi:ABC-2 type transport system ATP-binding protein
MLTLSNLRKSFGSLRAVDDLSLDIKPGEVFGLLGPNGAGKTTTVNMIVGLLSPDSGSVTLNGSPPTDPAVRAGIGVAPQALAVYEELSGRENLEFFGRIQGLGGQRLKERVDFALQFVGLSDRQKDRAKVYSGGMKRRLNLAVAIVHDPPILLLDEPTVGVDPQSRNSIFDNINALKAQGRTIVYTTHYMEEAERLCDREGIMDHGKLLALDTVDGLINAHGGKSIMTAEGPNGTDRLETDDPVTELRRLLADDALKQVRVDRPNLETVFLGLTGRELRD